MDTARLNETIAANPIDRQSLVNELGINLPKGMGVIYLEFVTNAAIELFRATTMLNDLEPVHVSDADILIGDAIDKMLKVMTDQTIWHIFADLGAWKFKINDDIIHTMADAENMPVLGKQVIYLIAQQAMWHIWDVLYTAYINNDDNDNNNN